MPVLCQLSHPDRYRVSDWNIAEDPAHRAYWLDLFGGFPLRMKQMLAERGESGGDFERRWAAFVADYAAGMAVIRSQAGAGAFLTTIGLCRYRQELLQRHGWPDPFMGIKARENDLAVGLYPQVIKRLDAAAPRDRWELLLRGLLAGNMFDLGAPRTIEMYERGEIDFFSTFEKLPPRPWFVDGADGLLERLRPPVYRQALIFADNCGADVVLGIIPLARELARQGVRAVIAANSAPALNDVTLSELRPLLERLAKGDPVLAEALRSNRMAAIGSGGDTPLIDLGQVSEECDREAAASDLIMLQGMGRAVESNWHESFRCDVWRMALLKDESVVRWRGGQLFDAVCRFDPALS